MNILERWLLKKIIGSYVRKVDHRGRLVNVHRLIREVVEDQFPEDNRPSINAYLNEVSKAAYK